MSGLSKTADFRLKGREIVELTGIIERITDVSDLKDILLSLELRFDTFIGERLSGHDATRELIVKLRSKGYGL